MREAMRASGLDPDAIGRDDEALRRIGTYVELHVEQGRRLVDVGSPVGVATEIVPHGRWRLDLHGRADHAGTTRIQDRDDPMLPLSAVITTARSAADWHDVVATIGKVLVTPNGVNAIPSQVTAWLDARGPAEDAVRALVTDVGDAAGTVPVWLRDGAHASLLAVEPAYTVLLVGI